MTVTALHAVIAIAGWLLLRQTVTTEGLMVRAPDPLVAEVFAQAALTSSAVASVALLWAGRSVWRPRVALGNDLASLALAYWPLGVMWLGPWTLELGGSFLVVLIAARVAPAVLAVLDGAGPALALVTAVAAYAGGTIWATQWSTVEIGWHLAAALAAAWASAQLLLILRDLFPRDRRTAALVWALASALLPLPLLVTHPHVAVAGVALAATAYRAGFTATVRRPALGTAGIAIGLLLPSAGSLFEPRLGLGYGIAPLPERAASIFFDRSLGIAATAPWLLIGIAAIPGAVRRDRRLLPAAIAVAVGLLFALFSRSWEGLAPPAYATVASLPLLAPFVAAGLLGLRSRAMQVAAPVLIGVSALSAFAMAAFPPLAQTSFGDGRLREMVDRLVGVDPLAWLPEVGRMTVRELGALALAIAFIGLLALAAYPRRRPMIDGVLVRPLKRITDPRGAIMHMLRADDPHFERFGEIYFSVVNPGVVKGWHLHSRMTLNYAVPQGRIRLVLYDPREGSPTRGQVQEIPLGGEDYALVRVPAGVWNAFLGLGGEPAIVANCATEPHDPQEIVRKPPRSSDIPYEWGDISPVSG